MSDPTDGVAIPRSAPPPQLTPSKPVPKMYDLDSPILTLDKNITIRHYRHSDAAAVSKHGSDPEIGRNMRMRWPMPYTIDVAHDWIAMSRNESNWLRTGPVQPSTTPPPSKLTPRGTTGTGQLIPTSWAICMNDTFIGGIGFQFQSDVHACTLPFGYWVGREFWRQGVMSIVLPAVIDWVWDTYPWIVKLEPGVYSWNPGSARLLEKCGFEREGVLRNSVLRLGVWADLWLYGLIRPESKRQGKSQKALTDGVSTTEAPELRFDEDGKLIDLGLVFDNGGNADPQANGAGRGDQ